MVVVAEITMNLLNWSVNYVVVGILTSERINARSHTCRRAGCDICPFPLRLMATLSTYL